MLPWILIALVVVIVGFLIIVALQPADFVITRSATMSAAPAVVFAQVNDFRKWLAWSPWAKLDPACQYTYEGPPSGVGAISAWTGIKKVGKGRMTMTESRPYDLIAIELEFMQPFVATNMAEFSFKPEGAQTLVTWKMTGRRNFVFKGMSLFMNMDKMIGGDFEKGLAGIKTVVESAKVQ